MQPRKFIRRQAEERPNNYTRELPTIDKTRATAVLVRRSKKVTALSEEQLKNTTDAAYIESREAQLELVNYAKLLYGSDTPNVRLYDEGDGVSGQKRIDQREKLDRLYQDMNKGIIGTIVVVREDRLFRNKHMDQVGVFTKLAEEKKIKLIVPPISSAASDEVTRVYDFTVYQDHSKFQDKMKESYGFLEGHVKYMNQCKQNKADKGGYDGRNLPPGLAVKGKKQDQIIIIYEPWAKVMRELALRAQALDWDMGKLNSEVAGMVYLFPEIPSEDKERYTIRTTMYHILGVGYKPRHPQTIKSWLTNVMYIGWWLADEEKPDTIEEHHSAILDYALFAEGYARLKGYTLDGEPVDNPRGITRIRKSREVPPEALFHSRLITPPPSTDRTAFVSVDGGEEFFHYIGHSMQKNGMLIDRLFTIPVVHFDALVIERLNALAEVDENVKYKVKSTLEQTFEQQGKDFVSIHDQLEGIEIQLKVNARKIADENDEELEAELRATRAALLTKRAKLEAKKKEQKIIDSPDEIKRLYELLGNFDEVWPTWRLDRRQRAFSLLMNRIEVEVVSPHWFRLSVDWLDALCPRIDVAYVWRVSGTHGKPFSDQEKEIVKQHYPSSPQLEILKLLPDRTWRMIQAKANTKHIKRNPSSLHDSIPLNVCYRDLDPKLDRNYLFRDYETTLNHIKAACSNTRKSERPLHALWLLSPRFEDHASLLEWDLSGVASERYMLVREAVHL